MVRNAAPSALEHRPAGEATSPSSRPHRVRVSLALQGGGAHGAFTWGALDRLLEEESVEIGRISGTSAGAFNGAALATGLAAGGREGARENLAKLWQLIVQAGAPMSLLHVPLKKPWLGVWDDTMPLLSPYQSNPVAMEPLRYVLNSVVDVELLRSDRATPLYVNAVNVHTGRTRIFGPGDLSIDTILASACAPLMFQAVEIDGTPYWDGSYAANPALSPLYGDSRHADAAMGTDIILVELTPVHRAETPISAKNILNRINEIASLNGVVSDMQAIDETNRRAEREVVRLHVLSLPESVASSQAEPSTKRTVGPFLFEALRREGYEACARWLTKHRDALGVRSTVDLAARYLARTL